MGPVAPRSGEPMKEQQHRSLTAVQVGELLSVNGRRALAFSPGHLPKLTGNLRLRDFLPEMRIVQAPAPPPVAANAQSPAMLGLLRQRGFGSGTEIRRRPCRRVRFCPMQHTSHSRASGRASQGMVEQIEAASSITEPVSFIMPLSDTLLPARPDVDVIAAHWCQIRPRSPLSGQPRADGRILLALPQPHFELPKGPAANGRLRKSIVQSV
jgi:hypothetical protein